MKQKNHVVCFAKGRYVFHLGEIADCAYLIESGSIGIYSVNNDKIAELGVGELFGEMGVIDESTRSTSAIVEETAELMLIKREQITKRLQKADPIIRGVLEVLLHRIRSMLRNNTIERIIKTEENLIVSAGMHKIRFEKELLQAIENDKIINVYQPLVNLVDGSVAGFEALSRWNHPKKGMVSPFEFVSLAEESDLIITMGLNIFDKACRDLHQFQQLHRASGIANEPLFMSINVSPAQLSDDKFLIKIKDITKKHKVKASNIKIEITESLMLDYDKVKALIDDCKHFGFKLSLDDFGTGYSGFQNLLELDFDTLKIDQAFVKSIHSNKKSLIMLDVISQMATRMQMSVVAEGIEDKHTAKILSEIGVDYGQGYYFYKPKSVAEIRQILSLK